MYDFKLERQNLPTIAYRWEKGELPFGVLYLHGWTSSQKTPKAEAISKITRQKKCHFVSLDYRAHGASEGNPPDFTIGNALKDTEDVLQKVPDIPFIVVGNSIGGWIGLLVSEKYSTRVAGFIGLAPAVDITEEVWNHLIPETAKQALKNGDIIGPTPETQGFCLTKELFEDGEKHFMLPRGINYKGPVRILWGDRDNRVRFTRVLAVKEALQSQNVHLTLIKGSDHHLTRPSDLELIQETVGKMIEDMIKNETEK